jgi:hypothetical protein
MGWGTFFLMDFSEIYRLSPTRASGAPSREQAAVAGAGVSLRFEKGEMFRVACA